MEVVVVSIPAAAQVCAVEAEGDAQDGDAADGIDDGQVGVGGGGPGDVDDGGAAGGRGEGRAGRGRSEFPLPRLGMAAEIAQFERGPVLGDGGDAALLGPGDGVGGAAGAQVVDALLEAAAGGRGGQDGVAKQVDLVEPHGVIHDRHAGVDDH